MALKLKGSTSGFVAIDAPSVAGNNTLILPENTGSAHQILANDITAGVTTFTQITVSRNGDLTVPGTISIGGTLTYEDVTSVDSVGIVTARGLSIFGNTSGLSVTGVSTFAGDVNITNNLPQIYLTDSNSSNARARINANGGNLLLGADNDNAAADSVIYFEIDGSEKLRIDSSGRLLIGHSSSQTVASSADCSLQVVGSNFSNSGFTQQRFVASALGPALLFAKSRSGTIGTQTIVQNGDELGKIRFYGSDGNDFDNYGAEIKAIVDGTPGSNDMPGRLVFSTTADGAASPTERLRITAGGAVIINGTDAGVVHTNADDVIIGNTSASVAGLSIVTGTSGYATLQFSDGGGNKNQGQIAYNHANDSMVFTTAESTVMTIQSTGIVKVEKSDSSGLNAHFLVNNSESASGLSMLGSGSSFSSGGWAPVTDAGHIRTSAGSANGLVLQASAGDMRFYVDGSPTERMRIASDGEVFIGEGLGNTNRSTLLSISGAYQEAGGALAHMGIYSSDSYAQDKGGSLLFGGQDGSVAKQYFAGIKGAKVNTTSGNYAGYMAFYTRPDGSTPVERMRMDEAGRIGMGVNPSHGRVQSAPISFNPFSNTWLSGASYVSAGGYGGGYSLLDGSKGYSLSCYDNGNDFYLFPHSSTTAAGSGGVYLNNAATSWSSASDERDKENLVNITDAMTKVKTLRTVIGNYIWKPEVKTPFLIAQDVQSVLPEAVTIRNKGQEEERLGMSYQNVIPLVTAALKEAIAEIETLKAKVAALEGS